MTKIYATGFEDDIEEDRPTLYVSSTRGNIPGVREAQLTYVDAAEGIEVTLGCFAVEALRDALNALDNIV